MEASDTEGILRQNLIDAGCNPDTIGLCMNMALGGRRAELMRILFRHRQELLNTVHQNEKRIDCLDYLLYKLEKQNH